LIDLIYVLAARLGRKRGKMNLEKTINKNMFNMSSAIHNANPLIPRKSSKVDSPISAPLPSILNNPKQKLTTQFKRAITAIKNRNDSPQIVHIGKVLDSPILPSHHDESSKLKDNNSDEHSSSFVDQTKTTQIYIQTKSSSSTQILETKSPSTATIIAIDLPQAPSPLPTSRSITTHPASPSSRLVKQSLQQIHSSILQTMQQPHSLSTMAASSSATLSPTSTSSSAATGEIAILETIL